MKLGCSSNGNYLSCTECNYDDGECSDFIKLPGVIVRDENTRGCKYLIKYINSMHYIYIFCKDCPSNESFGMCDEFRKEKKARKF